MKKIALILLAMTGCATGMKEDPNIWLENNSSKEVREWVLQQNKTTDVIRADSRYKSTADELRVIFTAKDRIPYPTKIGNTIRNFWTDQTNLRGLWRQTTFEEYKKSEPKWETILDIDALNKKESRSWVYKGTTCLSPSYDRCIVYLSDGGQDKVEAREFIVSKKAFVSNEEQGFNLPSAKHRIRWLDENTLFLGTDFGPESLTTSGYPRQVRLWKRGTPWQNSKIIFEAPKTNVSVGALVVRHGSKKTVYINQNPSFFEQVNFLYQDEKLTQLPFPLDSEFQGDQLGFFITKLRSDWKVEGKVFKTGTIVSLPMAGLGAKDYLKQLEVVFEPNAKGSVQDVSFTKDLILISYLEDVRGRLVSISRKGNMWFDTSVNLPSTGSISVVDTFDEDNHAFVEYESFNLPRTIYYFDDLTKKSASSYQTVKSVKARFKISDINVSQKFATSSDGTRIPYFLVHKKSLKLNSENPTLLYGYGGFENSEVPYFSNVVGKAWLEKGGVYVLANIRGGGEYGPAWHAAALKENRQKAYDDFTAISKDLIQQKITSPRRLGIMGGSNGGLLVGVTFTQHPELYNAVVCSAALLDMIRYTQLPPGASWIGEYGDPADPKMHEVISKYSPYQNVKPGVTYPEVLFYTSSADDRVHPGHSRKMIARLAQNNHKYFFFENTEGGHGGAADIEQSVQQYTLEYVYLYRKLFD